MEAKTMGSFLAALRKAAGMTQRELAEQLHVSDKAVSRWERDECAPDLALIPVIAEIFSVTCDELLRGGRDRGDQTGDPAKADKQRQWILRKTRSKFISHTLLALLGPALGAVAAAGAVLGFLRAVLGFWLGAAGCLVGAVVQLVLWNGAVLSLSDDRAGDAAGLCRYELLRRTEGALLICAGVLAALLPLNGYTSRNMLYLFQGQLPTPYWSQAAATGGGTVLLGLLLCRALNPILARHAPVSLPPETAKETVRRVRARSRVAWTLAAALSATALVQGAVTLIWPTAALINGAVCDTVDEFRAVMSTNVPAPEVDFTNQELMALTQQRNENQSIQFQSGLEGRGQIRNRDQEAVISYSLRNQSVVFLRYTPQDGDQFPAVEVVTYADAQSALDRSALRQTCFLALYVLEAAAALVWALCRRRAAAPRPAPPAGP